MLTNDQLLSALKAQGLTVREYPGWRDLCRCHNGSHAKGGPQARLFDPVDVMVHITAGGLGSRTAQQYIRDIIVSDPVTPLKSQFVTEPDGTVWIVSAGRCNHAGKVGSGAVSASKAQRLSLTGYQDLRAGQVDGNVTWYGIENIAAKSMTAAQEESSVRICAAVALAFGRTGQGAIGHGEASNQRAYSDPNLDMGAFRKKVMARVRAASTTVKPAQPSTTIKETDMPTPADLWNAPIDNIATEKKGDKSSAAFMLGQSYRQALGAGRLAKEARDEVQGLRRDVESLTALVQRLADRLDERAV